MTRWHWLELAEPISLVGTVAGSIVATVSGQVVYAVTPLALTVSVNWVNRHRLQQLQSQQLQQYSVNAITEVEQKTQAVLVACETQIKALIEQQSSILSGYFEKEQPETLTQIRQQLGLITESLSLLSSDAHKPSETQFYNLLREQLSEIESQINNQEISEALKALATKQEVNTVSVQLTKAIQEEIANFPVPIQPFEPSLLMEQIEKLNAETIGEIQLTFSKLQKLSETLNQNTQNLEPLKSNELTALTLKQELDNVAEVFTELVEDIVNRSLTSNLNANLADSLKNINHYLENDYLKILLENISQSIAPIIVNKISEFTEFITYNNSGYQYKLIFDRSEGRQVLIEALKQAKKQLILVSTGLTENCLNTHHYEIRDLCKQFLEQGGVLKLGYGKFKHINPQKLDNEKIYGGLNYFKKLAANYPNRCQIKFLGTHENFLVCDDNFAMLGSYEFLTYGDQSEERELGLKTNNQRLIEQLIKRFENAANRQSHQKNNKLSLEGEYLLPSNSEILSDSCRFCGRPSMPGQDLCFNCMR
ncbi:hypothetical protein [Gloeothece verrucosa]|uniref:Phospholipase D-like domain-containing protein n=1 Tax=Gloeothece verrucosa (strain PCC 7822) TaxID=497965 RepID=E0U8G7_GLOV7|nr:hypothetical protein [Gloeothece verrucosa]ADN12603.1 hypothetical protein Cyan7822_0565 [Gloeothece verrucosa PCC 7822]